MSRKANRKCKMCGKKVKPGETLCPACKDWEEAGNRPAFFGIDFASTSKGPSGNVTKTSDLHKTFGSPSHQAEEYFMSSIGRCV